MKNNITNNEMLKQINEGILHEKILENKMLLKSIDESKSILNYTKRKTHYSVFNRIKKTVGLFVFAWIIGYILGGLLSFYSIDIYTLLLSTFLVFFFIFSFSYALHMDLINIDRNFTIKYNILDNNKNVEKEIDKEMGKFSKNNKADQIILNDFYSWIKKDINFYMIKQDISKISNYLEYINLKYQGTNNLKIENHEYLKVNQILNIINKDLVKYKELLVLFNLIKLNHISIKQKILFYNDIFQYSKKIHYKIENLEISNINISKLNKNIKNDNYLKKEIKKELSIIDDTLEYITDTKQKDALLKQKELLMNKLNTFINIDLVSENDKSKEKKKEIITKKLGYINNIQKELKSIQKSENRLNMLKEINSVKIKI